MKSFPLLLILSLITGHEAEDDVDGCLGGWVEFTCKYPTKKTFETFKVNHPGGSNLATRKQNQWEDNGKLYVFPNKTDQTARVVVKTLTSVDVGVYTCKFDRKKSSEHKLKLVKGSCKEPRTVSETTISCDYDGDDDDKVKFLCKDEDPECVEIQSTGMFTLTRHERRLSVTISSVSSQDAGVYWCGLRSDDGSRTSFGQTELNVQSPPTASTPSVHQTTGCWLPAVIGAVVSAAVLVPLFVLIYRRYKGSQTTSTEDAQSEDRGYAEIEERHQMSDCGTAAKTVYVTAIFPTNPSAFTQPPNVQSQHGPGDVTAGGVDQGPTYSTVNQPSSSSEKPLYVTIGSPH